MREYCYNSKHLNLLNKYSRVKLLFIFMFCLVILLQAITWLLVWGKDIAISTSDMIFVGVTLVGALSLVFSQMVMYRMNANIIKNVKSNGEFKASVSKVRFSNKSSWAWGYVVLTRILCLVFIILLGITVFNFIQNYVNWGKIILKMPLTLFLAVGFLNLSAILRFQINLEKLDNPTNAETNASDKSSEDSSTTLDAEEEFEYKMQDQAEGEYKMQD